VEGGKRIWKKGFPCLRWAPVCYNALIERKEKNYLVKRTIGPQKGEMEEKVIWMLPSPSLKKTPHEPGLRVGWLLIREGEDTEKGKGGRGGEAEGKKAAPKRGMGGNGPL